MLRFYKFSAAVPAPEPARETYHKRQPGRGWPEECPPLRAANAFGWDVLAATDLRFVQQHGAWSLADPVDLESDWVYTPPGAESGGEEGEGTPLVQRNAWFWEEDQMMPHVISKEVYPRIRHQVKVSTYLFIATDPNELLLIGDIPNIERPFRVLSAIVDTDWYPASYPWHCVLELDPSRDAIEIAKGEPLCRLFTLRRDHYFAREMSETEFERYFQRSQEWLARFGHGEKEGMIDITRTYVKQQQLSKFSVVF
jgi:hypothetical protein